MDVHEARTSRHAVPRLSLNVRVVAYAALFAVPILLLAPWFGAVFDRDEGAYAVVAMGMREGLVPYRDLFDHKPPLIYAVYWLAFLLDDGIWLPRVFAAAAFGATAVLVVHTARALKLSSGASWCAGAIFALSTSNVYLQANANTEAFLLPLLTASLLMVAGASRNRAGSTLTTAGALAGGAVLLKTSAVFPAAALVLWLLVQRRNRDAAAFNAGMILPIAACLTLFASLGALDDFWHANVTYNRLYTDAIAPAERLSDVVDINRTALTGGLGLWLLVVPGVFVALRSRSPEALLLLLWAAGCWVSVKFTGRDHAHYYVQLLPAVALLVGFGAHWFFGRDRSFWQRAAVTAGMSVVVLWQGAVYATAVGSAERRSEVHSLLAHLHRCETAAPAIGTWLAAHTQPRERVYNIGRDSSIYYYAGRQPAARFMYNRPFYLEPSTSAETAAALRTAPPRYIVDTMATCSEGIAPPPEIPALLSERYARVAVIETGIVYELRSP